MSKCWYCNKEITSANNPEHLGICNKCYDEMFKCGNEFIKNMITKIADLEAKLTEKEKEIEELEQEKEYIKKHEEIFADALTDVAEKYEELKKSKTYIMNFGDKVKEVQVVDDNQDKISFAVAELEKAKIEFETYYADNIWNYPQYLEDRIVELTHQHEDKGE